MSPRPSSPPVVKGSIQGGDRAALLVSRARAQGRLGRMEAALADAADAVSASPRDETTRTTLGQALLTTGPAR